MYLHTRYILVLLCLIVGGMACSPLYVKNFKYEEKVRSEQFDKAIGFLERSKFYKKPRNRLLLLLEKGKVAHMAGDFAQSNTYLNEADLLIEDYQVNIGSEALALLTNDKMRPYKAEDFEAVAIHFYKALNFLALSDPDAAMVEARRLNLRLQALDDKFPDHKNKYDGDALAHVLMGQIYERKGDYSNAFVAYRNAVNLFEENEGSYMGIRLPEQLKQDIMRAAYISGFRSDLEFYERKFKTQYEHKVADGGELIYFWESGLGPVKDEWSINFTILADPGQRGRYFIVNNDLNLSFPFTFSDNADDDDSNDFDFNDFQFLRVAFPRYVFRPDGYESATLSVNGQSQRLQPIENIEFIARKSLQDRFLREAGRGLARLALKKISELKLRSNDKTETVGTIVGIVNAITEQADTRHWQTLPAYISYTRIPLQKGENNVQLRVQQRNGRDELYEFTVQGRGGLQFQTLHSMQPLQNLQADQYFRSLQSEPVRTRNLR